MKEELIEQINKNMFQLYEIGRYIMKKTAKDTNITFSHLMILRYIANNNHLNVGTLVKYLECDQGNLSTVLKKLEKKGLVERTRNPLDERQVILSMTKKGQDIVDRIDEELYQLISKIAPKMPVEKLEDVVHLNSQIVQLAKRVIEEDKEGK
ncbi:MAG: MarR family winged helix-turn-helix transcriptional regulator [Faecalibacillus sp.]